jgi:hypothetical protein
MHLLLPPALPRLVLVQSHEVAVVTLVERRVEHDGQLVLVKLAQDDLERVLRPLQQAGEGEVDMCALGLKHGAGAMGLGHAFLGQVDVLPAGEHIEPVPLALAVTDENERVLYGRDFFALTERHACTALARRLHGPRFRCGGRSQQSSLPSILGSVSALSGARGGTLGVAPIFCQGMN